LHYDEIFEKLQDSEPPISVQFQYGPRNEKILSQTLSYTYGEDQSTTNRVFCETEENPLTENLLGDRQPAAEQKNSKCCNCCCVQ